MSCKCFQVGGPFIAEDPNCPAHGIAAQERDEQIEALRARASSESDIEALRQIALEIASLALRE